MVGDWILGLLTGMISTAVVGWALVRRRYWEEQEVDRYEGNDQSSNIHRSAAEKPLKQEKAGNDPTPPDDQEPRILG
jgi:hypothetical protein